MNKLINVLRVPIIIMVFAVASTLPAQGARILAMQTIGGKSHLNFISGVLEALVDKGGHYVTLYTPFPGGSRENYTVVDTSDGFPMVVDKDFDQLLAFWGSPMQTIPTFVGMCRYQCDLVYANAEMERLLSAGPPSGYDAVIAEPFMSKCASYAAVKLNVPLIMMMPIPTVGPMESTYTGHQSNPAVMPSLIADHGASMSFVQRLVNTVVWLYLVLAIGCSELAFQMVAPRPYDTLPSVTPSLMFVNGHYATDTPSPTPVNVIRVGGIHLKAPKRLPEDILEFIEQSPHEVILFTFGSTLKWSSIPKHIKNEFLEGLAQIPQNILLKYEDEMEDTPKNVMTKKWLPQRDILIHPKVKLFISHGGIGGIYEALDAGVPILGFPIIGDQPRNIGHLVDTQMAISMDITTVTKDTFLKNVFELLNNKQYTKNAKIASKIFKDRPMSPEELVVYWTEYVIRHKGASHLKSKALNLTWYQYYLLDIIAFLLLFVSVFTFITYTFIKYVLNCIQNIKLKSE